MKAATFFSSKKIPCKHTVRWQYTSQAKKDILADLDAAVTGNSATTVKPMELHFANLLIFESRPSRPHSKFDKQHEHLRPLVQSSQRTQLIRLLTRVVLVSASLKEAGDAQMTMVVLALPPNDS